MWVVGRFVGVEDERFEAVSSGTHIYQLLETVAEI